jgi:hypothetical protein
MLPFSSLRQLTIDGFSSLTSFPTDGLPKTLLTALGGDISLEHSDENGSRFIIRLPIA